MFPVKSVSRIDVILARIGYRRGYWACVLRVSAIADKASALAIREGLKNFYTAIKKADADLRFVFMTGVSKFSKVSLFSGLNNLNDITLDPRYSAICGYTDADVDTVFAPELAGLPREEIRRWYNGYNWLGEAVYNPYDLLLLFDKRKFDSYWFETATPTFLVKLLAERHAWLPNLDNVEADVRLLAAFDVDEISTTALMFQSGYLTIATEKTVMGRTYYQLRFPNQEVRQSLYDNLLKVWTANPELALKNTRALPDLLNSRDFDGLKALFHAFYSGAPDRSIPHQWYTNNKIELYEGYYASVFYAYFAASGLEVRVEDATNFGRIDMAVILAGQVWVFEFKVVESVPDGSALRQIKERAYADKYRASEVVVYLVGVEFSKAQRNVVGFEVALLADS